MTVLYRQIRMSSSEVTVALVSQMEEIPVALAVVKKKDALADTEQGHQSPALRLRAVSNRMS